MSVKLNLTSLLVYSESNQKYFFTTFSDGVNIVYGRNTSGKSTLFQSIIYSMGINDGHAYLDDILQEKILFRLDCTIEKNGKKKNSVFIREDETLFIKIEGCPIERFNGISSDNSREHIRLKDFLSDIFNFTLKLEAKDEYKIAPIEAMWLPYYISQSVGWVYLRKSFSNLDFFRNFKSDYNDYYLGIGQDIDRLEKQRLQNLLKIKKEEIELLSKVEKDNEELQVARLEDEEFLSLSNEYLQEHAKLIEQLRKNENDFVLKCNELRYFEQRLAVLKKVEKNHKQQSPQSAKCPTCTQQLPSSIEANYIFFQDFHDTEKSILDIRAKIKEVQSAVNSIDKKIKDQKDEIAKLYATLNRYFKGQLSYQSWLNGKANVLLITKIEQKIGQLYLDVGVIEDKLRGFKSDDDLLKERNSRNNSFSLSFGRLLTQLGVKQLIEERHTQVYQISSFPSQGVELHKTVMAYHFAFNAAIREFGNVHRFPFLLDAIFKEDIDAINKQTILTFISKNRPKDTQLIFSVAQSPKDSSTASDLNESYFGGKAKLINIGNSVNERAFLEQYSNQHPELLDDTFNIILDAPM